MYLIVIGAGEMSSFFVQMALDEGHDVALIESDEQRARAILDKYDIMVFQASIGQGDILNEAKVDKADAIIATTEDDAANLMAMFLGVEHEIKTLISIVNERAHQGMFKRLGVQVLVDPEAIIAHYLFKLLLTRRLEDTINLPGGETIFETTLTENCPLIEQTPAEAMQSGAIADDMLIVSLKRGDEQFIGPTDNVTLQPDDRLVVFSQTPLTEDKTSPFTR
jgi:trk system potassium uptake protein TrkA